MYIHSRIYPLSCKTICHDHMYSYYCRNVDIDESVDGAAFLDLSEDDLKLIVKPLGHVKRVLRLISSVKTKVISSMWLLTLLPYMFTGNRVIIK